MNLDVEMLLATIARENCLTCPSSSWIVQMIFFLDDRDSWPRLLHPCIRFRYGSRYLHHRGKVLHSANHKHLITIIE